MHIHTQLRNKFIIVSNYCKNQRNLNQRGALCHNVGPYYWSSYLSHVCMASGHTLTDQANFAYNSINIEPQRIDINESSIACMYICMYDMYVCWYICIVYFVLSLEYINHTNSPRLLKGSDLIITYKVLRVLRDHLCIIVQDKYIVRAVSNNTIEKIINLVTKKIQSKAKIENSLNKLIQCKIN